MGEIVIVLILILLNGIFAMAEIARVSARKSSLQGSAKHVVAVRPFLPLNWQRNLTVFLMHRERIRSIISRFDVFFTKLLQKSEMRKDIVIELSYKGFS